MTKRLSPERIADGTRLLMATFGRTADFTERVVKLTWDLLGHIEAIEAELQEVTRQRDWLKADSREEQLEIELAEAKVEIARLRKVPR